MYLDDFFNSDKYHVIGTALANHRGGVVLADASIYAFFSTEAIPDLSLLIREEDRELFREKFNNCTEEPAFFTAYIRRYDGVYVNAVISVMKAYRQGVEYIKVRMYDILYMAEKYDILNDYAHKFAQYMNMSGQYYAEYHIMAKNFRIYKDRDLIYESTFEHFIERVTDCISKESKNSFYQICENIKSAKPNFFHRISIDKAIGGIPENSTLAINGSSVEIDNHIKYVVCTMSIIKSNESLIDAINMKANLDPLTGLYNKAAIKNYVIERMVSGKDKRLSLAIIDLDNFKMVNDTYGHMFGDDTLVTVATVLKSVVGNSGAVGRIGGDEFMVALENFADGQEAIRPILKSIRDHVEWSFKNIVEDIKITCSIGIATYPEDADNYDNLFKLADRCLYIAKSKGRDRFIIYIPSMHGTLEQILSESNTLNMMEFVSETAKNNHLLSIIDRLNSAEDYIEGRNIVRKVMLEMLYYYSVDRVGYYPFDPEDGSVHVCNYDMAEPDIPIKLYDTYAADIKNDLLTIGNSQNVNIRYPQLFEYLDDNIIHSMAIYRIYDIQNEDKLRGLFVISTYKRYKKWSAFDIKYLSILFKLLSKYV